MLLEAEVWSCTIPQPRDSWIKLRKCYFNLELISQGFSWTSGFLASLTESEGLMTLGPSASNGTMTGVLEQLALWTEHPPPACHSPWALKGTFLDEPQGL